VIGSGGMAVVYKALCHRLNRFVAIKILRDEF
jgi:serine/threonine protein kinase